MEGHGDAFDTIVSVVVGNMTSIQIFPKLRILLVAAVCAGLPRCLPAQIPTDIPVDIPTLSQPLTDNPGSAPVTTLDTDLITPYRPFAYDPTGANILSTSLSPLIDTTNTSTVRAETDTAIRDSSQTGQISPYAAIASRLGLAAPGETGSATDSNQFGTPAVGAHFGVGSEEGDGNSDQSSWGTSSSFGPQSAASLRGARAKSNERLGVKQSASSDNDLSSATSEDNRSSTSTPSGRRNRDGTASLRTMPGTTMARGGSQRPGSTGRSAGMPSSSVSPGPSDIGAPTSGEAALAFSPQSYVGYSFGESPFSSPGGNGERTFLNPNIFAVATPRLKTSGESSGERRRTLRERLEEEEGLATSTTGYGLASRDRGIESERYGNFKKKPKKNPYLVDEDDPENQ
jgi:hypothetical protein